MVQKLNDAMDSLEEIGDKTNLNAVIAEAETKVEEDYTPDSWLPSRRAWKAPKRCRRMKTQGFPR